MKESTLVIVKPDGMRKQLAGLVLNRFSQLGLKIAAIRLVKTTYALAEQHYQHIKGKPFFKETVSFFMGKFHHQRELLAIVFYGEQAIKKCRKIAGATNPEEANPLSIRGAFGRITTKGIYENVVHVSSTRRDAQREIKLWFEPDDLSSDIYPVKIKQFNSFRKKVWA